MVDITKGENGTFSITRDGETDTWSGIFYAKSRSNSVYLLPKYHQPGFFFGERYEDITVGGVAYNSAEEVVVALSEFIGSFSSGAATPSPTPENGLGNIYAAGDDLLKALAYVFVPDADGGTIGKMIDLESAGVAFKSMIDALVDRIASLEAEVASVRAIAEGAQHSKVFEHEAEMHEWLADLENVATLQPGNNFLIIDLDVPDYWWTGTGISILETAKVDLSGYANRAEMNAALAAKANDSEVVKTSGDQAIEGVKTFTLSPIIPTPTTAAQATNKGQVDSVVGDISTVLDAINGEIV